MPRPRLFYSSASNDWISPLLTVSRGLASVGNCIPFPYVSTALSAGVALLELIQTVGKTTDDLKYLAESVVTIMKLLRQEMDAHPANPNPKLHQVCVEFNAHLSGLSKDIGIMAKDWSSSKFKKYLKANCIRDEIAQFTRRVADLRADATVRRKKIQSELADLRSGTSRATKNSNDELVRFEEDVSESEFNPPFKVTHPYIKFHALKMGDIELAFDTARTSSFVRVDNVNSQQVFGWTDYKGYVKGSLRTVRVYQGSDTMESWKGFLSVLAEQSPSPYLPQLFGFCSSPGMRSLVFHGDFQTLDEYGGSLHSSPAIVDWELTLIFDFWSLHWHHARYYYLSGARRFALVNSQNGKLLMTHVEPTNSSIMTTIRGGRNQMFLEWFEYTPLVGPDELDPVKRLECSDSQRRFQVELLKMTRLIRRMSHRHEPNHLYHALTSRGGVYFSTRAPFLSHPIAKLENCEPSVDAQWRALHKLMTRVANPWPPREQFPSRDDQSENGWTHFVVPLSKTQKWISLLDGRPYCGYFLNAQIELGANVPDVTEAWLAQSGRFIHGEGAKSEPSQFLIPTECQLVLEWEMVLFHQSKESLALLDELPAHIHVFLQVPTLAESRISEPLMYWSTDPMRRETSLIPTGMFQIRFKFSTETAVAWWEQHHYDVIRSAQHECGFDPTTTDAAEALNLPLLQPCCETSTGLPLIVEDEDEWTTFELTTVDPHMVDPPLHSAGAA
ncbi:hypothetical protein DFH09DRAFT_1150165 [Mycena vulgaris]|nr:hypothetical protein DFH09DRAFT_1150165 [Mycena vulgaris]